MYCLDVLPPKRSEAPLVLLLIYYADASYISKTFLTPFVTAPWQSSAPQTLRLYTFRSTMAHGSEHAALLSLTIVYFGLLRVVVLHSASRRREARRLL